MTAATFHLDRKVIIVLSIVVAIGSVSWYVFESQQGDKVVNNIQGVPSALTQGPTIVGNISSAGSVTPIPTAALGVSPSGLPEFPPLFPGLQWQPITKPQVTFRTKAGSLVTREGEHTDAEPVATCPADFLGYYERQLSQLGWQQTWAAGADCGSFLSGDQFGYEQSGVHFQFGVISVRGQHVAYVEHD